MSGLRVAVAGGGLGGLCLAQGLLKFGVDVMVYERDAQLAARRQGYRLHVDARAGQALEQCLPPESFAVFQATCGDASTRLTVMSERLHIMSEQRLASGPAGATRGGGHRRDVPGQDTHLPPGTRMAAQPGHRAR